MVRLVSAVCVVLPTTLSCSFVSAGGFPRLETSSSAPQLGLGVPTVPSPPSRTESLPGYFDHNSPRSQQRNRRLQELADRRPKQRKTDTRAVVFQGLRDSVEAAVAAARSILTRAQSCHDMGMERIKRLEERALRNPRPEGDAPGLARFHINRTCDMEMRPLRDQYERAYSEAREWMDRLTDLRKTEAEHRWLEQAERHMLEPLRAKWFRLFILSSWDDSFRSRHSL